VVSNHCWIAHGRTEELDNRISKRHDKDIKAAISHFLTTAVFPIFKTQKIIFSITTKKQNLKFTATGYIQVGNTNWESNSTVMKICDIKYNKNIISANFFMIDATYETKQLLKLLIYDFTVTHV